MNRAQATEGNTCQSAANSNRYNKFWPSTALETQAQRLLRHCAPAFTKLTGTGASKKPHTNTAKPNRAHGYRTVRYDGGSKGLILTKPRGWVSLKKKRSEVTYQSQCPAHLLTANYN